MNINLRLFKVTKASSSESYLILVPYFNSRSLSSFDFQKAEGADNYSLELLARACALR